MSRKEPRDVDWPLVEGTGATRPTVRRMQAGRVEELIAASRRLPGNGTLLELGFAVLASLQASLQLERVGLYLRSKSGRWLSGLVGTGVDGLLVDERNLRHVVDPTDESLWRDAIAGRRCFEVLEDAPLIAHQGDRSQVLGRGWFVRTPIVAGEEPLGHLYNDAALTGAPFRRETQELVAAFLAMAAGMLRAARERAVTVQQAGRSQLICECLERLEREPDASNQRLASCLRVHPNRLSRIFRSELGRPLPDYRNELRLQRFFSLVEAAEHEGTPAVLVDLALSAGFGSYSQFHRVFTSRFGQSPRRYLEPGPTEDDVFARSTERNAKPARR